MSWLGDKHLIKGWCYKKVGLSMYADSESRGSIDSFSFGLGQCHDDDDSGDVVVDADGRQAKAKSVVSRVRRRPDQEDPSDARESFLTKELSFFPPPIHQSSFLFTTVHDVLSGRTDRKVNECDNNKSKTGKTRETCCWSEARPKAVEPNLW